MYEEHPHPSLDDLNHITIPTDPGIMQVSIQVPLNVENSLTLDWACVVMRCCICAYEVMSQAVPASSTQHPDHMFQDFGVVIAYLCPYHPACAYE